MKKTSILFIISILFFGCALSNSVSVNRNKDLTDEEIASVYVNDLILQNNIGRSLSERESYDEEWIKKEIDRTLVKMKSDKVLRELMIMENQVNSEIFNETSRNAVSLTFDEYAKLYEEKAAKLDKKTSELAREASGSNKKNVTVTKKYL